MTQIIREVFAFRKRFKDDDLRKIHTIIEDEMKSRDAYRQTQKESKSK